LSIREILSLGKQEKLKLNNLYGSAFSVYLANLAQELKSPQLIIVNDREEALYLQNDLAALFDKESSLIFPTSYKKPYQYEEIDNANIRERTEVLKFINDNPQKGYFVISYPEALIEKVVNQKSLVKNTFGVKVGDTLDLDFVTELLIEYGFQKTDFVYEAGDFSIRGGILDVFSFSNELPFRIELFGNEVDSIRTFEPDSQLSVDKKTAISIIPDVQTKLKEEKRESFFEYIKENTCVWVKDFAFCKEVFETSFDKIQLHYADLKARAGAKNLITDPEVLFENHESFEAKVQRFSIIEFGIKQYFEKSKKIDFQTESQPSYNKQFNLLSEDLHQKYFADYSIIISTESIQLSNKLEDVLEQHDKDIKFQFLNVSLYGGFIDHQEKIVVYTDHQIFDRYHRFKEKERFSKKKVITLNELKNLNPGDFVTHIDYGVARFAGLVKQESGGIEQECIRLVFKDDDVLYINVHSLHKISKHSSKDGEIPKMSKLGSPEWENKKSKVKKRVKELAFDLISLYAKRKEAIGFQFSPDSYLQAELETSFLYEDTPDQYKATEDVKRDMEMPCPMDRLVCGDVGFGKTEVAIRAAFKAVTDSKQVAVMVPTTILALQHYNSFRKRLKNLPCKVDFLNRFRTTKEITQVLKDLKEGKIDILIGTHKLVGKDVEFKDLGLLIIDEEQKFGVAVKDKLKSIKNNIDVLTLTATPIPRTLQFSLMGARDLSIISTPPPNRRPVTTEVHGFDDALIRDAISTELKRNGQVFFVHNRIASIEEIANRILRLVPDARIAIAHGQMDGKQLEKMMLKFIEHEYDVLVSTNIIESGLDIPNANTIIINNANMYGLSDLHQMRGRVGRSNKKAYCYLITQNLAGLTADARKKLSTLEEFSDLGDGFKVAMKDLDLRGSGDLLGGEQSGFINDIGMDAYQKIMEEAVEELKDSEFKALFNKGIDLNSIRKTDCNIETDLSLFIPEYFVENISERLRLYNQLDGTKNEVELQKFIDSIHDRFGKMPNEMLQLIETVRLRWEAERLGFEKLKINAKTMKGFVSIKNNDHYFQSEIFGKVLNFVKINQKLCSLKEVNNNMILTFTHIPTIKKATEVLQQIV